MKDIRVLYDDFESKYNRGMKAVSDNNFGEAKKDIYGAYEALLRLARESSGVKKVERLNRANKLYELFVQLDKNGSDDDQKIECNIDLEDEPIDFKSVCNVDVSFDDVAGLKNVKDEINRLIITPRKHPEIYSKFKKKKGGGILLYGVPGTGKTMIAQAIASEIDAKFYQIKCSDIVSKWFGDSEQKVKSLFEEARKNPCSIIFFDEFEALGAKRGSNSTVMNRLVPELLAQMQGFEKNENTLIIIAATNRPWDIDSAFLRPGRFNTCIHVTLPDEEARRAIVLKQLDGVPVSDDLDINKIVEVTNGFNASDVVEFCEKLKDFAIEREINENDSGLIVNEDVEKTLEKVGSSVREEDVKKIVDYELKFVKKLN